jgi:hypothetical protein
MKMLNNRTLVGQFKTRIWAVDLINLSIANTNFLRVKE